jgi:hypothetical protein
LDNTYIVKESTANGYGTQHQKEWENEETGLSVFKPHFFGWHLDPVNKMDLGVYQAQMGESFFANQEEIKMSIEHNLIDEQLAWRRWKIKAMQPSDIYTKHELFRQEFPITAREAFISSGKSIFSEDTIKWVEELCVMEPKLLGDLVGFDTPLFEKSVEGFLSIWEEPSPNGLYCLAGDVAEVHDYCYLVVGDKRTGRQVAEWRGRVDEFELALIAYRLGMYYNKALIGIERNNHGVAVVKKLDELAYANQYVRRTIDETYETYHNELGWRTDQATRPIMISDLNQSITNRTFIPRSAVVPSEMRTFVRKNKTGRAEAQPNCHDDAIIGNSILVQLFKHVAEPVKDEDIVTRGYVPNNSLYNYTKRR